MTKPSRVEWERSNCTQAVASPKLTAQESLVLDLLAQGHGYAEIGAKTLTSINTVRTHVRALYVKLNAENRAEAVNLAWRCGLLRT